MSEIRLCKGESRNKNGRRMVKRERCCKKEKKRFRKQDIFKSKENFSTRTNGH